MEKFSSDVKPAADHGKSNGLALPGARTATATRLAAMAKDNIEPPKKASNKHPSTYTSVSEYRKYTASKIIVAHGVNFQDHDNLLESPAPGDGRSRFRPQGELSPATRLRRSNSTKELRRVLQNSPSNTEAEENKRKKSRFLSIGHSIRYGHLLNMPGPTRSGPSLRLRAPPRKFRRKVLTIAQQGTQGQHLEYSIPRRKTSRSEDQPDVNSGPFWDAPVWTTLNAIQENEDLEAMIKETLQEARKPLPPSESGREHYRGSRNLLPFHIQQECGSDIQAMRNALLSRDPSSEEFEIACAMSEAEDIIECEYRYSNCKTPSRIKESFAAPNRALDADLEVLLGSITLSNFDYWDRERPTNHAIHFQHHNFLLEEFLQANSRHTAGDVTNCTDTTLYATHLKCVLHLKMRYAVQAALLEKFPALNNPLTHIKDEAHKRESSFLFSVVQKA